MKIRHGFVSNSSSSSFIISINPDDNTIENLRKKMFRDMSGDAIQHKYYDGLSMDRMTMIVHEDITEAIKEEHSNINNGVVELLTEEFTGWDVYDKARDIVGMAATYQEVMVEAQKSIDKARTKAIQRIDEWKETFPNNVVIKVKYSDDGGGTYAFLEHEGIVERIGDVTVKVSHH